MDQNSKQTECRSCLKDLENTEPIRDGENFFCSNICAFNLNYDISFFLDRLKNEKSAKEKEEQNQKKKKNKIDIYLDIPLNEIPSGLYIDGTTTPVVFDPSLECEYFGLPKKTERFIKEATLNRVKKENAWQKTHQQYKQTRKHLHKTKSEINGILEGRGLDKHPKKSLNALTLKTGLLVSLMNKSGEERTDYFREYHSIILGFKNEPEQDLIAEHRTEIRSLFERLCEHRALLSLKQGLLQMYPEDRIDRSLVRFMNKLEEEIKERTETLRELIPQEDNK